MGRCRFVQPEVVRIPLSDGDFIDVKKQLSWGEQQDAFGDIVKSMPISNDDPQLDARKLRIVKALTYIVGWSFCDAEGAPQPVNESTMRALDDDTGLEISTALSAHEEQMARARREKKTTPAGAPASIVTSTSAA